MGEYTDKNFSTKKFLLNQIKGPQSAKEVEIEVLIDIRNALSDIEERLTELGGVMESKY